MEILMENKVKVKRRKIFMENNHQINQIKVKRAKVVKKKYLEYD